MKERLIKFLAYLGIGQTKFEEKVGLSRGLINKVRGDISLKSLKKITDMYPELNENWLKTGEGEMLKKDNSNVSVENNNDTFSLTALIKAINNLSEAAVINANANLKNAENERIKLENERINAEVNERYSKNIEKMLNMLTGERGSFEKKELYQTI